MVIASNVISFCLRIVDLRVTDEDLTWHLKLAGCGYLTGVSYCGKVCGYCKPGYLKFNCCIGWVNAHSSAIAGVHGPMLATGHAAPLLECDAVTVVLAAGLLS